MRVFISSILLVFFCLGQVNLSWAKHYCDEKLISSELTLNPDTPNCCDSGKPDSSAPQDCCANEITTADADDYFGKADFDSKLSPVFIWTYVLTFSPAASGIEHMVSPDHVFPDIPIPDLNILHQSFLI